MTTSIFNQRHGKYSLYAECMYNDGFRKAGSCTPKRYYKTITEALIAVEHIMIPKSYCWRLIRTTDNKNFTNKIYNWL